MADEWANIPSTPVLVLAVSKTSKTLEKVLRGDSDASINFADLCSLLKHLGFTERVRGSHHIFTRQDLPEILNLQPRDADAKVYQVKQVRAVIVNHKLAGEQAGQQSQQSPQTHVGRHQRAVGLNETKLDPNVDEGVIPED